MKQYKVLSLLLALMMVLALFTGCGAAAPNEYMTDDMVVESPAEAPAAPMPEGEYAIEESLTDTDTGSTGLPQDQKIITTLEMSAETESMDPLLVAINEKVTELGGYMETQEIYNGSDYYSHRDRYARLTIRIPAEKLNSFVTHVEAEANIVSRNTSTENVTLSYVAVESRIKALETEETRLLELLAMAENMEDLLLIESRLTEVRTELEQVNSTLRTLDNKINYSTIHLYIDEVVEYTQVEEEPKTFWERISTGIVESFKDVGDFLVELAIFLITAIPYLLLSGAFGAGIFFIIWGSVRRKRKRNAARKAENK